MQSTVGVNSMRHRFADQSGNVLEARPTPAAAVGMVLAALAVSGVYVGLSAPGNEVAVYSVANVDDARMKSASINEPDPCAGQTWPYLSAECLARRAGRIPVPVPQIR